MVKYFAKSLPIFLLTLLLSLVFVPCAVAAELTQTHETKNGLSLNYPAGWNAVENAADQTVALALMNPAAPAFGMTITVTEGVPEGSMTMSEADAKAAFSQLGSDFKMLEYGKTKVAGQDATLIEYSFKANDIPMQNRQVMFTSGSKGIIVTSSFMDAGAVAELHKIVEAIESSITLK